MRNFLLLLYFLTSYAFANPLFLKDKLAEAEQGSFLVLEQNKTYTLLFVRSNTNDRLTIEEISIPAARYSQNPTPWRFWLANGAPGHTSWASSRINLLTGEFEETFSFTHQGWVDLSESNCFLTTLLNLPFEQLDDSQRRKIGTVSGHNRNERRLWNPRLVVDGHTIPNIAFTVWKARWPNDSTEVSKKIIEIYLPEKIIEPNLPLYPTYFPFWLEVEGKIGSAKIRVVDSGMNAVSPQVEAPRRL